jgi:hypothetical protein
MAVDVFKVYIPCEDEIGPLREPIYGSQHLPEESLIDAIDEFSQGEDGSDFILDNDFAPPI